METIIGDKLKNYLINIKLLTDKYVVYYLFLGILWLFYQEYKTKGKE